MDMLLLSDKPSTMGSRIHHQIDEGKQAKQRVDQLYLMVVGDSDNPTLVEGQLSIQILLMEGI